MIQIYDFQQKPTKLTYSQLKLHLQQFMYI